MTTMAIARYRAVPVRELARHTAEVLDAVAKGETVDITRDGEPIATMSPIDPGRRDLMAAVQAGRVDPAALDPSGAARQKKVVERLRKVAKTDPNSSLTKALLALRDEETR
jgi:prevent-host-death family protein